MTITATHKLLTESWTADVETVETAIRRFRSISNECQVRLFEMAGDRHLHVNVTHKSPTATAPGWAGPASLPQGFVHNRRFSEPASQIVRHIRNMVFAAPIDSRSEVSPRRATLDDADAERTRVF
ncbi:MAG TPA: hypothetical protein VFS23_09175 [Vicinamibacterales bacterium]|nr:hypothetical protein [Vicinamibacterales bacterium]